MILELHFGFFSGLGFFMAGLLVFGVCYLIKSLIDYLVSRK